jgi:hypothetical protein
MRLIRWALLSAVFACSSAAVSDFGTAVGFSSDAGFATTDEPPREPAAPDPCGSDPTSLATSCPTTDQVCEYGNDLDPSCNILYRCPRPGKDWLRDIQDGGDDATDSCFARCPATRSEIVEGEACNDTTMGCSYTRGTCACLATTSDAGDGGASGTWQCAPRPEEDGCPAQRPPLGSTCVREITCDYGSCTLRRDLTYKCVSGRWLQADSPVCP